MAERNNIVEDWLRSLNLVDYTQAFIDNGYDDLEVCKQIGEEDLDAIKVDKQTHRDKLLRAVQVLREEGGTAVYFTLEETDDVSSAGTSPRTTSSMKGVGGGSDSGDKPKSKLKPASSNDPLGGGCGGGGGASCDGSDKLGSSSTVLDPESLLSEPPPAPATAVGVAPTPQMLSTNPGSMTLADPGLQMTSGPMASLEGDWLTGGARRMDAYDVGQKALFSFTKVHLRNMLNDKLYEDEVYLANPPYTTQEGHMCRSSVLALAIKYADQLQTHLPHVLDSLEELWELAHTAVHYSAVQASSIPLHPMYGAPHHHYGYGLGQRGLPPPLPSCPPPSTSHIERCSDLQHHLETGHRHDVFAHQNYVALDGEGASQVDDGKKKGSTIGRFLRNLGIRKSGRKNAYKQQQGDLMAYEITMSDEDRMALMQMVKEGKISTETAVSVVKQFEEEQRRRFQEEECKENFAGLLGSPAGKKGTLKKKKSGSKPSKSQSSGYTGISPTDFEPSFSQASCDHPMSGICCRQRRVHSIGHIDQPQGASSPSFSRALSCSPTRTNAPFNSPFGSYQFQASTPPQPAPKMTTFGHVETLKERLTGNKGKSSSHPTKTSSQTSLLSSSSEQSMDCNLQLMPLKPEVVNGREQEGGEGGGSNSNMSTGSDYSPAPAAITSDSADKSAKGKMENQYRANTSKAPLLRQSAATSALYNSAAHAGAFIGLARAKIDFTPPEGDTDSLAYKKGDIIHIMATTPGGHGRGAMHGIVGGFLLANMEMLSMPQHIKPRQKPHKNSCKPKPRSVEELMARIGLEQLAKVFIENGFDTLELFSEIDERDLTTLGILQPEQRAKLLTAAELLLDSDSADTSDGQVATGGERSSTQSGVSSEMPSALSPTPVIHPSLDGPSGKVANTSHDPGGFTGPEQLKKLAPRLQEGGVSAGIVAPSMAAPSKCLCRQCGKPKPQSAELSAEDQEVFSITVGSQQPTTTTTTTTLAAPPSCSVCTHPTAHSQSRCESKSSKQSLSSACTQLTSLSPEEEVGVYDSRHGHDHAHNHSHRVVTGQWETGCVQCAQEAALMTSKMAGQDSPSRVPQQQSMYPYLGYGSYEGYPQYPDYQAGGTSRSGRRTPSSMHYGVAGSHYGSAVQHSHYASSHYRSHYAAHSAHYGSPHSQMVYYGSQSAHYYPTHHYATQAPYGSMAGHYRTAASSHYAGSQAGTQQHSPVTLSLSASSSTAPSQPSVSLKLNRSVSHESGTLYPACASPRGPDYSQGAAAKASRSPTRSLIPLVKTKLSAEGIILTDEPYSTPSGECGIPPLLVQRYAEELRLDVMSIALLLEQVRTLQLHALQRPCVPNELLADDCRKACNLQISSLAEFFISIGLPMYIPRILSGGVSTVQHMLAMTEADIPRLTGADSYHVKRISHAIQWVKAKLNSPTQGSTTSSSSDGKSGGGGGGSSSGTKQNSAGSSVKDKV